MHTADLDEFNNKYEMLQPQNTNTKQQFKVAHNAQLKAQESRLTLAHQPLLAYNVDTISATHKAAIKKLCEKY